MGWKERNFIILDGRLRKVKAYVEGQLSRYANKELLEAESCGCAACDKDHRFKQKMEHILRLLEGEND